MYNNTMYELGSQPSLIRELFAYGLEQAKIVGPENVFTKILYKGEGEPVKTISRG